MKVGMFYNSVHMIEKAPHKREVFDCFAEGVRSVGDEIIKYKSLDLKIKDIECGVILGYSIEDNFRRSLINFLQIKNIPIVYIDSNIFVYGKKNTYFHRYSVNGVYPTDGEYFIGQPEDENKLNYILNFHEISLKPWRQNGNHILVLGQRTKSWNMLNKNGLSWIYDMVDRLIRHTDRPIVVRLHPGDVNFNDQNRQKLIKKFGNKIQVSLKPRLQDDLFNAWCSVGFNSTPNCSSVIEGVPVYLDAPENSWAKDVAFSDLAMLENPATPDRRQWLNRLASIHWSNAEIREGQYWKYYKSYYKLA